MVIDEGSNCSNYATNGLTIRYSTSTNADGYKVQGSMYPFTSKPETSTTPTTSTVSLNDSLSVTNFSFFDMTTTSIPEIADINSGIAYSMVIYLYLQVSDDASCYTKSCSAQDSCKNLAVVGSLGESTATIFDPLSDLDLCYLTCSGWDSCESANVSYLETISCYDDTCDSIIFSHITTVYCSGILSCSGDMMSDIYVVQCSGSSSCRDLTLTNVTQLYCSGDYSCHNVRVEFSSGASISCSGSHSCQNSVFIFDYNDSAIAYGNSDYNYFTLSISGDYTFNNNTIIGPNGENALLYGVYVHFSISTSSYYYEFNWVTLEGNIIIDYMYPSAHYSFNYLEFSNTTHISSQITVYGDQTFKNNKVNTMYGITCNGWESCQNVEFNDVSYAIYCGDTRTCQNMVIKTKKEVSDGTSLVVTCAYSETCQGLNISAASTIYCEASKACNNIIVRDYVVTLYCTNEANCNGAWFGGVYQLYNEDPDYYYEDYDPIWRDGYIRSTDYPYYWLSGTTEDTIYGLHVKKGFDVETTVLIECQHNHTCFVENGRNIGLDNLLCYGECIIRNSDRLPQKVQFPLNNNCGSWIHESIVFLLPFCIVHAMVVFYWVYLTKILDFCYQVGKATNDSPSKPFEFQEYTLAKIMEYDYTDSYKKLQSRLRNDYLMERNSKKETMIPATLLNGYLEKQAEKCVKETIEDIISNVYGYYIPSHIIREIFAFYGTQNEISFFYCYNKLYPKYHKRYIHFWYYFIVYQYIAMLLSFFAHIIIWIEYWTWYATVDESAKHGYRYSGKGKNITAMYGTDWHFYQSFAALYVTNYLFFKFAVLIPFHLFFDNRTSLTNKINKRYKEEQNKKFDAELKEKNPDMEIELHALNDESRLLNSESRKRKAQIKQKKSKTNDLSQDDIQPPVVIHFSRVLGLYMKYGDLDYDFKKYQAYRLKKHPNESRRVSECCHCLHIIFEYFGSAFTRVEIIGVAYLLFIFGVFIPITIPGIFVTLVPGLILIFYFCCVCWLRTRARSVKFHLSDILDRIYIAWDDNSVGGCKLMLNRLNVMRYVLTLALCLFVVQILFYVALRMGTFSVISVYRGNLWVDSFGEYADWGNNYCTNDNWILYPKHENWGTILLWISHFIA